jgi:hypothetical protein
MNDCAGNDACVHFASDPSGPGVCADPIWAYNNPPCVPLCRDDQLCVDWGDRPASCGGLCQTARDCSNGCCLQLQGGEHVCAPDARYCTDRCNPPCTATQVCIALGGSRPACADTCTSDGDCGMSCCLPLQGGGGACSPGGVFCPTMPQPACRTMESCTRVETQVTPGGGDGGPACGAYGGYDGRVQNDCTEPVVCRACWYSLATHAYSDCVPLGQLPSGATVPAGTTRCEDEALPAMPLHVRCVDVPSFEGGNDCLGQGPL